MHTLRTSNRVVLGVLVLLAQVGCGSEVELSLDPGEPIHPRPFIDSSLPPVEASSGMCAPAEKVYVETLPDSDATAADFPLTEIKGLTLPAGAGKTETRIVFTSESAFRALFGVKPPNVDFSKEWVMFYSAGESVSSASSVKIVRVRERTGSVRVTTVLGKPAASCVDPPPGIPFTLVRFPSPGWTSCRVSFYHRDDSVSCPPPWEPGRTCLGSLTAAGIDNILRTRPRPLPPVSTRSIYYSESNRSFSLGNYEIAHFQRTCTAAGCQPWISYPLEDLLDYYRQGQILFNQETFGSTTYRTLIAASREWIIDFTSGSTTYRGDCGRWADGKVDVSWDGTRGTVAPMTLRDEGSCRTASSNAGASLMPIKDHYGSVDSLPGVMTDRCVLLKRKVATPTGRPGEQIESLTTLYTSW